MKPFLPANEVRSIIAQLDYARVQRIIAFIICLLLLLPDSFLKTPSTGIDASWSIAIHQAVSKGLVFGKDFVLTYGPLGILSTKLPIAVPLVIYVLWDLYIYVSLIFLLAFLFRHIRRGGEWFIVGACFVLQISEPYATEIGKTLSLLFLLSMYHHAQTHKVWPLVNAAFISCINFFIKIDFGLVLFFLFLSYLYIASFVLRHLSLRQAVLWAGGYIFAIVLCALAFKVQLWGYLRGAFHLTIGYQDAMFLPMGTKEGATFNYLYLALSIFASFLAYYFLQRKVIFQEKSFAIFYGFILLFLFLFFKHAFVRADWHIRMFFAYAPMLAIFVLALAKESSQKQAQKVALLTLLFSFPFANKIYDIHYIAGKAGAIFRYIHAAMETKTMDKAVNVPQEYLLPPRIVQQIGQKTVDIMPWEVSLLFNNHLNYKPRPVIQNYTAYDDYLDRLNKNFLLSPEAPDFLIGTVDEIDGRHPLFTESQTRIAMLAHYRIKDSFGDNFLFEKRTRPLPFEETQLSTGLAEMNGYIELPHTSDLLLLSADIQYSLIGWLASFFFQPPLLMTTVQFENGEEKTFRAIKTMVNAKVIVNRFFANDISMQLFFDGLGAQGINVKKIKFFTPNGWGFQKVFRTTIYQVHFPLKDDPTPERVHPLPPIEANSPLKGNIDQLQGGYLKGWVIIEEVLSRDTKIYLVLRNHDHAFCVETMNRWRHDVSIYFQKTFEYDFSGFEIFLDEYHLPLGSYQIGIYLESPQKRALQWLDYYYTRS